ncbi:MAG: hypothetical protein V1825_03480 [Candidatus Falkowbacteria bacterium]|nr:hypothetical protein [Candidatus Parcubacteria bacterium]
MNELKNKRILIFQQRGWGKGIGRFLAKKLYAEGCELAALTFKRTTHELIVNQPDLKYELIINNDEVMSRPKDYLAGDEFLLEEICERLGVDSIWPMVSTLRNHVRSYKDKYYYGFKQNVPDDEIIDFIMAVYKYMNVFFDKFNPDVIIAPNFVALPHIMFNLFAQKRGVPMIAVTDSKIKGYFIFTQSYKDDRGAFYERVDSLNEEKEETNNRERAKKYIKEFRQEFKKPDSASAPEKKISLKKKIRQELSPYVQCARWYIRKPINVLESTGITLDYRPPKIMLRDHYCQKIYKRFMNNYDYYPFDKIKKFIYFPLQFQPEATIDVVAPYFSNQIETARQIAMSLPDDYTLVVKEHPAMVGLRPPSYIEKIARTVNIKLIDYRIPSEKVLKKADLIISPNSTTLAEAAFYNKPAIQLGYLGTTKKLPNVFIHTDMTTISSKIKDILSLNLKNEKYEKELENYTAAVYDTGFDYEYIKAWERGGEDMEPLWQIYKKEIKRVLFK